MFVQDIVDQFESQSILVTGDTYLDRELYGNVTRLSPEAPVPVVKITSRRTIPGGAANVAKNISSLGGKAILIGLFGEDPLSQEIARELPSENIKLLNLSPSNYRLPEKYRIFASNQQLLQMFQRTMDPVGMPVLPPVLELLDAAEIQGKVLVVYDQGYGFVNQLLMESLVHITQSRKLKLFVDADPNHVSWYGKASLYTFNADESLQAAQMLGKRHIPSKKQGTCCGVNSNRTS